MHAEISINIFKHYYTNNYRIKEGSSKRSIIILKAGFSSHPAVSGENKHFLGTWELQIYRVGIVDLARAVHAVYFPNKWLDLF